MNIVSLEADFWYDPDRESKIAKNVSYINGGGTSASAAIITGITAVLLQHYPNKNVEEIKENLKGYSVVINDLQEAQGWGFPYIDE